MVRQPAFRIAAWVALLSISAAVLPVAAAADAGSGAAQTDYHYSTTITTVYGSQYPIAGHLDLEIASGWNPARILSQRLPEGVHSSRRRTRRQLHLVRHRTERERHRFRPRHRRAAAHRGHDERDGSFRGQAFPQVTVADVSQMTSPVDQATKHDQYIFAAMPMEKSPEDYQGP